MLPSEKRKAIQEILGVTPDSIFGARTDDAYATLKHAADSPTAPTPPPVLSADFELRMNSWPVESQAGGFYGHSDGSTFWESANLVVIPAPYRMFMGGEEIKHIRCHKKVAASLQRILTAVAKLYNNDPVALHDAGLDQYDGCYNFRPIRGSLVNISMHAYGAAIDFDAADNPLGSTHGKMPMAVVSLFESEGWKWGGKFVNRKDWMHFQATA